MPARNPQQRKAVARLAHFDRFHPDQHDSEKRARLVDDLHAAQAEQWVLDVVRTAPPLNDEQRVKLARIVLGGEA